MWLRHAGIRTFWFLENEASMQARFGSCMDPAQAARSRRSCVRVQRVARDALQRAWRAKSLHATSGQTVAPAVAAGHPHESRSGQRCQRRCKQV